MNFVFITFDKWLDYNIDPEELVCSDCLGSGNCECDCGNEHDCGSCDGSGKIRLGIYRIQYNEDVKRTKQRLAEWLGYKEFNVA